MANGSAEKIVLTKILKLNSFKTYMKTGLSLRIMGMTTWGMKTRKMSKSICELIDFNFNMLTKS
jgi:hypothetical protein